MSRITTQAEGGSGDAVVWRRRPKASRIGGVLLRVGLPLAVAALLLLPSGRAPRPAHAVTPIVVNIISDLGAPCLPLGTGPCDLPGAISLANAMGPGQVIDFNIPPGGPAGILLDVQLPDVINPGTVIDGTSQPGYLAGGGMPIIDVSGSPPAFDGLNLLGAGDVVKGLALYNFRNAIDAAGGGADIEGDFIGATYTGALSPNVGDGVYVTSAGNQIGSPATGVGPCSVGCNLVVDNLNGIHMTGPTATGNFVEHGGIEVNTNDGVLVDGGASKNTIGVGPGGGLGGNVISGNRVNGVEITGAGTTGNTIQNDAIGTDATGTFGLANKVGVLIAGGATTNHIGTSGGATAAGNVISGNTIDGVDIAGAGTSGNDLQRNTVGLSLAAVPAALPNGGPGVVVESAASANHVGLPGPAAAPNVISGNGAQGVAIFVGADGNFVQNNLIGTDPTGTTALPNQTDGVYIEANANTIGGTAAGDGNTISGNTGDGVHIVNVSGPATRKCTLA